MKGLVIFVPFRLYQNLPLRHWEPPRGNQLDMYFFEPFLLPEIAGTAAK